MNRLLLALFALVSGLMAAPVLAQSTLDWPDGVEVAADITQMITLLGAVVAVVIGGFLAFRLVKIALRWIGRIGG